MASWRVGELASWLALTHGSEVTLTDWNLKICHKNVAMSAAHETLTFGAGGEATGVPGFGGLTVSDHSAHQHTSYVERAAGVSVVGAATLTDQPVRPLITRARVLAQHSNVGKSARVSSFSPPAGALMVIKADEMAQWREPLLSGGRASCARSLKPEKEKEKERKYRHRASTVCRVYFLSFGL